MDFEPIENLSKALAENAIFAMNKDKFFKWLSLGTREEILLVLNSYASMDELQAYVFCSWILEYLTNIKISENKENTYLDLLINLDPNQLKLELNRQLVLENYEKCAIIRDYLNLIK